MDSREHVLGLIVGQLKTFGFYAAARQLQGELAAPAAASNRIAELLGAPEKSILVAETVAVREDALGVLANTFSTQHRGACTVHADSLRPQPSAPTGNSSQPDPRTRRSKSSSASVPKSASPARSTTTRQPSTSWRSTPTAPFWPAAQTTSTSSSSI